MPSPRPLRSGIDFQTRYAVWRLVQVATRAESFSDARRMRIEWPLPDDEGDDVWVDIVLEGAGGEPLEVVECREHARHIPPGSVESFLRNAKRLCAARPSTTFRYVSTAWILPDGRDLTDPHTRRRIVQEIDPALLSVAESARWDLGVDKKGGLFARTTFALTDFVADARWFYAALYSRLAAMLGDRLPGAAEVFRDAMRDLQVEIFGALAIPWPAGVAPEDAIDIDELRRRLGAARRSPLALVTNDVTAALRAGMYADEEVSTEQVFVEQTARYDARLRAGREEQSTGVLSALFDWLADVRELRAPEEPLLLMGPFGAGKSTAFRVFAATLLERSMNVVPIFIRLRDLAKVSDPAQFDRELCDQVLAKWNIDIKSARDETYCLLCDGFDELNLYYSRDGGGWAETVYKRLTALARQRHVAVAISSRPLQLLDVTSPGSRAERAPRIVIEDFTPEQGEQWCLRYRKAAKLDDSFSWSFLEQRNLVPVARTPIILYMIARIYATSPDMLQERPYTLGEIYLIFIDWTVRGGYVQDEEKHRVPSNYRRILQEIAWQLAQAETGMLPERELLARLRATFGTEVEGLPVDRNLLVAHMLQPVADGGDEKLVEFKHQSFRDYLVAEWILDAILSAETLREASRKINRRPPTQATLGFIADRIGVMEGEEERLAKRAESDPERQWELLGAAATPESVANVAALMFLIRVRAMERLRARGVDDADNADVLGKLLRFCSAFESPSVAGSREALLRNLSGAHFRDGSLAGLLLQTPALHDMHLEDCDMHHIEIHTSISDVSLTGCSLYQSAILAPVVSGLTLNECNLMLTDLFLGTETHPGRDLRIERCDLRFCSFRNLVAERGAFVGNNWDDASVESGKLIECTLDTPALEFFRSQNVTLIDCRMAGRDKWRLLAARSSLTAELEAMTERSAAELLAPFIAIVFAAKAKGHRSNRRRAVSFDAAEDFVIEYVTDADRLVIPDVRRYLVLAQNESTAESCRQAVRAAPPAEVNVWNMGDLVDAAFDSVARSLDTHLVAQRPWAYSSMPLSFVIRELSAGEHGGPLSLSTDEALFDAIVEKGRPRLVIIHRDDGSTVGRRLAAYHQWPLVSVDTEISRPEDILRGTRVLADALPEPESSVVLRILEGINNLNIHDETFTLVADVPAALVPTLVLLSRHVQARLVISTASPGVTVELEEAWRTAVMPRIMLIEVEELR